MEGYEKAAARTAGREAVRLRGGGKGGGEERKTVAARAMKGTEKGRG